MSALDLLAPRGLDKKTDELVRDYSLSFARTDPFLARLLKREISEDQGGGWPMNAEQLRELSPHIPEPITPDRYDYILEYLQD